MAELTSKLCRELVRFLGEELVNCHADTVDYRRIDTDMLMKSMGKTRWRVYYEGSVWIDESKGTVGAGDVVVPIELEGEMVKRLEAFSCKPEYIHRHPEFGTSHIHLSDCRIRDRVSEFARLVSE